MAGGGGEGDGAVETVDLEGAAARDRSTVRGKGEEVSLLLLLSIRYGCGGGWKEESQA